MFRRLMLAVPLAGLFMITGCTTASNTQSTIQQIQAAAVAACGFLPTAQTIANILAAGNPLVTGVGAVASAICAAVTAAPPLSTRKGVRRGVPMVSGVVIHGRFVR